MQLKSSVKKTTWRNTKVRGGIMDVLNSLRAPASVLDILNRLSRKGLRPNKTTVYRDIETLVHEGVVVAVDFGDRTKRYELAEGGHHHHLVCKTCGGVEDIELGDDLVAQKRSIARKSGFVVESHNLEFFGICKTCAK